MIELIPVVTIDNMHCFSDSTKVVPKEVMLGDVKVMTAPLVFDKKMDLLGISQTSELLENGFVDSTDSIDPSVTLKNVYMNIPEMGVHCFDVSDQPSSAFFYVVSGSNRELRLDGSFIVKLPNQDKVILDFNVTGKINLELGQVSLVGKIRQVIGIPSNDVGVNFVGYDLSANRTNLNRRSIPA